ncbi:MAG: ribokinase [Chloroflexi bacterium]|nr:ribokinase [Chloroflexota bacterium]
MTRIVVVGSANVDLVVQAPHIPRPGETVLGRDFVMALGGKGANQAVGVARLGAEVVFLARVGKDSFGDQCLDGYAREGINTSYISLDPEEATGVALIVDANDGENSIAVASGANMRLTPELIADASEAFEGADGVLLQLEIPIETVVEAARIGRKHGIPVVLNPAPAQPLQPELLSLIDVLTPNRIELAQLLGVSENEVMAMDDERLAKHALGLGVPSVVITLGKEGALAAGSWGWTRVPSFAVETVDTTAAGDAFNAGLAVALGRGGSNLPEATRYACACGALATTKFGAQPSLPDEEAVQHLLAR